eukprot:g8732.t1
MSWVKLLTFSTHVTQNLLKRVYFSVEASVSTSNVQRVIAPNIPKILENNKPKLFIDGQFVDAASGKTFPVVDPRTEETIIQIAEGDAEDVNRAVSVARKAFDEGPWPKMSGRARGKVMFKFADLLEKNVEELAQLETLNCGKPLLTSRSIDIPYSTSLIRYFAGYIHYCTLQSTSIVLCSWADKIHGKTIPIDGNYLSYTLREPKGVIGQITPWNFPLVMMCLKLGPALATGNTMVVKCAEQTPLTSLMAAELALEAGIPPGVINVVPGYGPTAGAALASHLDVDKVSFTGSTEVGQKIMKMAAVNVKDITVELGGKSPLIIFPDADLEQAANIAHSALFINSGQQCTAGSRVFVHSSIYEQFIDIAATIAKNKVVGDPFTDVEQGPQIDRDQFQKVMKYIQSGKDQGADLICGGSRIGNKGFYIEPTLFGNVQDEMEIARDEIFGPVQSIFKFEDIDEVIRRANDTTYGLAAGVLTNDINTANRVSRALRAGTVWVNCFNVIDHATPVTCYKMSGIGHVVGQEAVESHTQIKTVTMPLQNPAWI